MNKPIPIFNFIDEWSKTEIRFLDTEDKTYVIVNVKEFEQEFFKHYSDDQTEWGKHWNSFYGKQCLNEFFTELYPEKFGEYVRQITFN